MTRSREQDILVIALIAILVWLPLPFGSNQAMYWMYGEAALQGLSIVVLLMFATNRLLITPSFRAAWLPLGIFTFFLISQLVIHHWPGYQFSADQQATNHQLIKTLCLFQIFCLTLLLINSEGRFKLLVRVLLVAGTFQAVYGTLMTVTGTDYIWSHEKVAYRGVATGTFINRNHLAGYLEMTLALGLGLMIANLGEGRSRTWRQFFRGWTDTLLGEKARVRICLVLMVIGLILTRSRMGNTAFFVGMGVAGIIGLFVFRRSQPGVVALFVSILIIDIFLLGTFFGIEELQQRLENTNLQEEQRITAVILGLGLLPMAPWLGHGLGAFYSVFPQVRDDQISLFYDHAHADLLEFPIELGIVGTLPLVMLFCLSLYMAIRVQLKRHNRFYRAMGFSVTMAMVSIGLHSTTDFNLQIFANAGTFVCILAMPWLSMHLKSDRSARTNHSSTDMNHRSVSL
ncbi:MAG: O-antigen ligase family protein [Gammaproteobacteria bacterium]|nr:O-antigen ligase family protein [Gammaproteobacteria bacterium]MBT4492572.1 O-antigen ligase family protein [Gammaproteobacteria bacterium]MBT7371048.1 O-antigen ligase family protein [Gammaproteobacteria bacterium]